MKLTFAGVGGAFTTQKYWQSNMVFESENGNRLLFDCGTDARFSFGELGATNANIGDWCEAVYISHLHADHAGGLEWLGFCTYFAKKKVTLYAHESLVDGIWNGLKGSMACVTGMVVELTDFFRVQPFKDYFCWEEVDFKSIQTVHVMNGGAILPSYGLMVGYGRKTFITGDSQFCPSQLSTFYDDAFQIFQDCETYPNRSNVHAHYDDLKTLPEHIKKKMWLYHYAPEPKQDAVADGFAGFVQKGQTFNL